MSSQSRQDMLERARNRARQARDAARNRAGRMFGGGGADEEEWVSGDSSVGQDDAVRQAVQRARQAANESRRRREEMSGGWKAGTTKIQGISEKRRANLAEGRTLNSLRTYKVSVNGQALKGSNKNKKTGEVTETTRYFHGSPEAAARKVIASLNKEGVLNVTGKSNSAKLALTEVTKGVKKADGGKFEYTYFGWREKLEHPIERQTPTGSYTIENRNIAIPSRGLSFDEALEKSKQIGRKIKAAKGL